MSAEPTPARLPAGVGVPSATSVPPRTPRCVLPNGAHALPASSLRARGARPGASPARGAGAPRLGREELLSHLRLEMRRADRSSAPLSIVLFCRDRHDSAEQAWCLDELLRIGTRETDMLGQLDRDHLAVILPDTGENGRQQFIQKIASEANGVGFTTIAATYPDHLFETLGAEATQRDGSNDVFLDEPNDASAHGYRLKRCLDVIGATLALLLLSPVMLGAAIAVALTSPGPVIFKQIRLGKGGTPFVFYKFRSMTCGSDDSIHRKFVADLINGTSAPPAAANGTRYKIHADPRITPLGRMLRKTSIDELPQLVNVLRGDMSLVGPRPPIPYEAGNYKSWHLRRVMQVRPGITGPWQVEGRSRVPFDDMVRMDLRYIKHCSLLLDLKILLKTLVVVLRCDGAK
jgi:lipopolysaccharide/colanic/teichoic acid biosynthesis glycosyltransferase